MIQPANYEGASKNILPFLPPSRRFEIFTSGPFQFYPFTYACFFSLFFVSFACPFPPLDDPLSSTETSTQTNLETSFLETLSPDGCCLGNWRYSGQGILFRPFQNCLVFRKAGGAQNSVYQNLEFLWKRNEWIRINETKNFRRKSRTVLLRRFV